MKLESMALGAGILLAGLLVAAPAFAQTRGEQGAWEPGSRYGRMYNPQTVQTVTGKVVGVETFTPAMGMPRGGMSHGGMAGSSSSTGMSPGGMHGSGGGMGMSKGHMGMASGVHLMLETATETISVHLGPSWFLDKQALQIKAGDQVKVTGSRITFDGKPAIVAAEVGKGDQVLKLRDAKGAPVWAGRRPK